VGVNTRTYFPLTSILFLQGRGAIF